MSRQITCMSCGNDFDFSDEDQQFFREKGFEDPKRCKPCRQAIKQSRGGGRGGYGGDRPPRELHDAVCDGCGIDTQVPFRPTGDKPVFCRDCFRDQRA